MSESLLPPVLSPASLYKEEARRDATRIKTYNSVLQTIYTKIRATARIPGNEKSLFYIMPEFIPGTPRFHTGEAVLYIASILRNSGYTVTYTHPNLLYISWKSYDEKYRTTQSPWTVVMNSLKTAAVEPTTHSPILKPQSISAPPPDVVKRKTPLKKTVEFRPPPDIVPKTTTHPTVMGEMYSAGQALPPRLPGQLGEKHVSFV